MGPVSTWMERRDASIRVGVWFVRRKRTGWPWWSATCWYTEVEVFLDKRVRETRQTAGANSRRKKKARDFADPFIHKSTLLSTRDNVPGKAKKSPISRLSNWYGTWPQRSLYSLSLKCEKRTIPLVRHVCCKSSKETDYASSMNKYVTKGWSKCFRFLWVVESTKLPTKKLFWNVGSDKRATLFPLGPCMLHISDLRWVTAANTGNLTGGFEDGQLGVQLQE